MEQPACAPAGLAGLRAHMRVRAMGSQNYPSWSDELDVGKRSRNSTVPTRKIFLLASNAEASASSTFLILAGIAPPRLGPRAQPMAYAALFLHGINRPRWTPAFWRSLAGSTLSRAAGQRANRTILGDGPAAGADGCVARAGHTPRGTCRSVPHHGRGNRQNSRSYIAKGRG